MRILIIEDDALVADGMRRGLSQSGFAVDHVTSAELAEAALQQENFDLLLVALGLPGADGFDLIKRLRRGGNATPVLIVTARDALADRVGALDLGADDYLVKPFGFSELLARIHALLRRSELTRPVVLAVSDLTLDPQSHRVARAGVPLNLTPKEYAILEVLMRHAGRVVTRARLADQVWETEQDSLTNLVDVHVSHLRRKVDGPGGPPLIHTIRGRGYLVGPATP